MPSTALMGYTTPVTGTESGTWGDLLNAQLQAFLDQNFAGINSFSLSASNVTLTASQARNQMNRCTGVLLANVAITPDVAVLWNGIRCVENLTSGSFTVTLTYSAISVVIPQGRRALVFLDSSNGPRIVAIAGSSTADPIPAGSATLFYNATAPSGWTASSLGSSYGIKAVDSGGGAVSSGTVPYDTLYARTATDSFTLTLNEIPAHSHTSNAGAVRTVGAVGSVEVPTFTAGTATSTVGSGNGHTHAIDMRVRTLAFVLATRN